MINEILTIACTDLRRATRSLGWWFVLVVTAWLPFAAVRPTGSPEAMLTLAPPDSLFVGIVSAHLTTMIIGLFCFYVVAGSVARDRRTAGAFIAATPLGNAGYVVGKVMGGMATLMPLLLAAMASTLLVFLIRGVGDLNLIQLWVPMLTTLGVCMLFVVAISVFLGCLGLHGPLVHVGYGLLWFLSYGVIAGSHFSGTSKVVCNAVDFLGAQVIYDFLFVDARVSIFSGVYDRSPEIAQVVREQLTPLTPWNLRTIVSPQRLVFVLVSLGMTLVSTLTFDRFDR